MRVDHLNAAAPAIDIISSPRRPRTIELKLLNLDAFIIYYRLASYSLIIGMQRNIIVSVPGSDRIVHIFGGLACLVTRSGCHGGPFRGHTVW